LLRLPLKTGTFENLGRMYEHTTDCRKGTGEKICYAKESSDSQGMGALWKHSQSCRKASDPPHDVMPFEALGAGCGDVSER